MKKTFKTYVILGVAVGAVLASGAVAFADTVSETSQMPTKSKPMKMERLTSTEDSMEKAVKPDGAVRPEAPKMNGMHHAFKMNFDKFVEKGIISQDTADAMTAYLQAQREERMANLSDPASLIQEGSYDCIKNPRWNDVKKEVSDVTDEKQLNTIKEERIDSISEMVTAGILTQEEADAIKAAQVEMMAEMAEMKVDKIEKFKTKTI